jgi:GNAT superfamily N-acetyltransferase
MEIERFKIEDAEKVSNLIKRCLTEVNSKDYDQNIINNLCEYYSKDNIIKKSLDGEIYVLKENEKIIGTARVFKRFISGVFVNPDFHKKGLGKKLMETLENRIKETGHEKSILYSNITSINFYEHLGYEKIGNHTSEDYGENIIMYKLLD